MIHLIQIIGGDSPLHVTSAVKENMDSFQGIQLPGFSIHRLLGVIISDKNYCAFLGLFYHWGECDLILK